MVVSECSHRTESVVFYTLAPKGGYGDCLLGFMPSIFWHEFR